MCQTSSASKASLWSLFVFSDWGGQKLVSLCNNKACDKLNTRLSSKRCQMRHWEIIYFPLASISTDLRLFRWLVKFVMKNDWYEVCGHWTAGIAVSARFPRCSRRTAIHVKNKWATRRDSLMLQFIFQLSCRKFRISVQKRSFTFTERFSPCGDINWAIIDSTGALSLLSKTICIAFCVESLINRGRRGFRLIYFLKFVKVSYFEECQTDF